MSKQTEALKLALEALEETRNALAWFYDSYPQDVTQRGSKLLPHVETVLTAIREALAEQPAQQQEPDPDRVKFERHWRKTRGDKKANRELPRHPLQPQTYIQDSANRHWVTWQAAVKSVSPPASKPLTDAQIDLMTNHIYHRGKPVDRDYRICLFRQAEAAHGIKE